MIRLLRRWWLRWRIHEQRQLVTDCEDWLVQMSIRLPQIRDQLKALEVDARLNEVEGKRRYRATRWINPEREREAYRQAKRRGESKQAELRG